MHVSKFYVGSDGSATDSCGAHVYGFTSGKEEGNIWHESAIIPGLAAEIPSLRAEYGGAIGVLLVLYALQLYMGTEDTSGYMVDIWIDNKEVISIGEGSYLKVYLVIDYDVWRVMNMLQNIINMGIRWRKANSHIDTKTYKEGQTPVGDEFIDRLKTLVKR